LSWTDDLRLRRVFRRRVVPAGERLRRRGVAPLATGPRQDAASWFVAREPRPPVFVELGPVEEELRRLGRHWDGAGLPELTTLIRPLTGLSRRLTPPDDGVDADVSYLIYPMY
jgi:hypothetical protein